MNENEKCIMQEAQAIIEKYSESCVLSEDDVTKFNLIYEKIKNDGKMASQETEKMDIKNESSVEDLFVFQEYLEGCIVKKYVGFAETEIYIPEIFDGKKVLAIDEKAFFKADKLTKITLPNTIKYIGRSAFEGCESLVQIVLSNSLQVIDQRAFRNTSLKVLRIPSTVYYIGAEAFSKCKIENVILPNNIAKICDSTFYLCENLKSINIPLSVRSIDRLAFSDCYELESVSLNNGLINIGEEAFCNCLKLMEISVPSSVQNVGRGVFTNRYTVQPDRRYNPRTAYRRLPITIKCFAGSKMQEYARTGQYKMERCEFDFGEEIVIKEFGSRILFYTTDDIKDALKKTINYISEKNWIWTLGNYNSEIVIFLDTKLNEREIKDIETFSINKSVKNDFLRRTRTYIREL